MYVAECIGFSGPQPYYARVNRVMSRLPTSAVRVVGLSLAVLVAASASPSADTTAHLTLTATVSGRTRLSVSARVLAFDVLPDEAQATTVLDFSAAARTLAGGEVVLTIEPEHWLVGPGGAADADAVVTFAGDGDGTLYGALQPRTASVAGRWVGSGLRDGRLFFTLQTAAPGSYRLPVRFVLSTP